MEGINLIHGDSLQALKGYADNHFDVAIVDPPYGIDDKLYRSNYGKNSGGALSLYSKNRWDVAPSDKYFNELMRVSKNQIIWGGNYFSEYLKSNRCWICWNKDNPAKNFSSIELAWTSFDLLPNYFYYAWGGFADGIKGRNKKQKSIHPTQKPIALYRWILDHYTNENDLILDTHLGSGSIAIACHYMKRNLIGYEIDKDYYDAACKRFKEQTMQQALW